MSCVTINLTQPPYIRNRNFSKTPAKPKCPQTKEQTCRSAIFLSVKKKLINTKITHPQKKCQSRPGDEEVRQVRRGVRRSVSAHLLPVRRSLVQAGDRTQLLLCGPRLRAAVRHQEVSDRPESRVRGDGDGQRGGGGKQLDPRDQQANLRPEEHGHLPEGHLSKPEELRAAAGRDRNLPVQGRRLPHPGLLGLPVRMSESSSSSSSNKRERKQR